MSLKATHLHIRVSAQHKALLARAAKAKNMSLSQFILDISVPIAEEIVWSDNSYIETLFRLDAEAWEEFNRLLDAPAREIPELKKLFALKAPWEK